MPCSWLSFSLLTSLFITSIFPASSSVSYTEPCSSIVPESSTTTRSNQKPLPYLSTAYFSGGDTILRRKVNQSLAYGRKSFRLRLVPDYYETIAAGTYKVEGLVLIRFPYRYNDVSLGNGSYVGSHGRRGRGSGLIRFSMNGFWSERSRKLCMVGSALYDDAGGKTVNLNGVLKLNYGSENNPDLYTGVVSGILESTNSANDLAYFDPFSIFSFPVFSNYNYSAFSFESEGSRNQSFSLEPDKFCSIIQRRSTFLEMEYAEKCREEEKHHHCSFLGLSPLPRILYFNPIQCSDNDGKLRYLAKFQDLNYDDQTFNLDSTVIGEALWDDKSNSLVGIACRLVNPLSHFGDAVGDCTMRLSWRYPSILTIRNDARIVGQIWSSKSVNDSGYFPKIDLGSFDVNGVVPFPGARYEYTEMGRVRKSCERKAVKKKGDTYPDGQSYNMRFDISINSKKGEYLGWGFARPGFVGDDLYSENSILLAVDSMAPESAVVESISEPENRINTSPVNITYEITMNSFNQFNWSRNLDHNLVINAEGVYDGETGYLCMVGCRKIVQNSTTLKDCEILVKFQFAPFNARGGLIKGTIESTRAKTDPLHFDDLIAQSAAYYTEQAEQAIWRMDFEITLVLISNTLACIFIGLQILHVKRNPEVPSFVSLVMLVILSLGHMIPLVLNFDAIFLENRNKQTLLLSNGGKIEANEVTVRLITMVAFLLQIRLLQLVWTVKKSDSNEKKAGFVSLALYIIGGLLTFVLNWTRNRYVSSISPYRRYSIWGDLRSYAGLILDGFLLPQIMLNIFMGSAQKALSGYFYIGISAVRMVPHAYNQYRVHNYPQFDLNTTYYYANPAGDFYSTAWDIIIPCGVVVLAVIVFVQQRHGGRCVLPQRFRGMLEMYEKVPTGDNE